VIICNHCAHENHEGAIICNKCGHVMEAFAQTIVHTRNVQPATFSEQRDNPGIAVLSEGQSVCLQVQYAPDAIILPRANHSLILGRATDDITGETTIDLSPYQAYKLGVSRKHANIIRLQGSVVITDLGSANGTYVNGKRLEPNQRYVLRDGDEVCLGQLIAHVYFA
jgi:hypothetical protein